MKAPKPLSVKALAHTCDPKQFKFKTTAELEDLTEIIGQSRAVKAVHFGIGIRHEGYNLYIMGPPGIGKHTMVGDYLPEDKRAGTIGMLSALNMVTALVSMPAAGFVAEARNVGAHTVELNLEPSEGVSLFHENIHGRATEIVPDYVEKLVRLSKNL